MKINDIVPTENEEFLIKDCICSVINVIDEQNFGLKSISNDGYSKTFENTAQSDFNKQIQSIISLYLGGTRLYKSQFIGF